MIYLDNAATTKPSKNVIEAFLKSCDEYWANPSSLHKFGEEVFFELKNSRDNIKKLLNIKNGEIFFTSSATESINLFFKGFLKKGDHIIISDYEHAAVYESARNFENEGGEVTYIKSENGTINPESVINEIKDNTKLVAVMFVNNEIGAINPIKEICKQVKMKNSKIKLFVDGVQAVGKLKVDIDDLSCDAFVISPHKFHGLKGTGILYVKDDNIKPQILGGGQEQGLRSGTENVGGIFASEVAIRDAVNNLDENIVKFKLLKERFLNNMSGFKGFKVNSPLNSVNNILNISFERVKAEVLVHMLEEYEIYVNTSSACSKNGHKKSRTLTSIGLNDSEMKGALRISFSDYNTVEEIDIATEKIKECVDRLRLILWENVYH